MNNFLAEIQKIIVYRNYSEEFWDTFLREHPMVVLVGISAFIVLLIIFLVIGNRRNRYKNAKNSL